MAQKSKPLPNYQKMCKTVLNLSIRLYF